MSGIDLISKLEGDNTNSGLFKKVENGAAVVNLNIVMSRVDAAGVSYVGAVCGTLENARIINVTVSSGNTAEPARVVGFNSAGGIVGRIIGDSFISNAKTTNISVTAGNEVNINTHEYNRKTLKDIFKND